ncbi:MAG: hypothetical protein ACO1SV_22840 [Fimbriimonas sp.]
MIKKLFAAATLAALLLVAGCGGGGSKPVTEPSNVTKQAVLGLLVSGINNSSNIRSADGGATRSPRHARQVREGEENGDVYFDEWIGLWVKSTSPMNDDPGASGDLYFEDQALTTPGGHRLTWLSQSGVYPITGKDELVYTAGNFKGERDLYEWTVNEDESGSSKGEGNYPGVGSFVFQGSWTPGGISHFTERFDAVDGSWQEFELQEDDDLSYVLTINSSLGVKFTMNFAQDQSGTGRIQGNAQGLPATLVWDMDGNGTVTWSDGTTQDINIYEL